MLPKLAGTRKVYQPLTARGVGIMADDSDPNVPSDDQSASSSEVTGGIKPPSSWVLPLITALVLGSAFCLYYFVYVAARRDYLANRNFRSLAMLGDQIQSMVSIHGSVLEFSADLADPARHENHKESLEQFVVIRSEDKQKQWADQKPEALTDYLKYLAPGLELRQADKTHAKPPKRDSRLEVQRRNGRWELVLTADRHGSSQKEAPVGSLELSAVLKPLVGSQPFDDILLVSQDGTIVYQSNKSGPQFTTLTRLLQAQTDQNANALESQPTEAATESERTGAAAKTKRPSATGGTHPALPGPESKETGGRVHATTLNADPSWRAESKHLTDVVLAGTRYKLFLQPVLVDAFTDDPNQDEPVQEWVLCGLTSAKTLEWEALSISSTFIVWLTALFLIIFMSAPVLKVLFINRREHLRLRELGFLGFVLILLASVFTLSGLNAVGFPLNDDTEDQLQQLGNKLTNNIHSEMWLMRKQLLDWCRDTNLRTDLYKIKEDRPYVIRGGSTKASPLPAKSYPYLNNVFWTNDDGKQIVKWSPSGYLTPMIDLSRTPIYTHPKSTYLDGKGPLFHFDSIMPPNKLEYLAGLTISTEDCNPDLLSPDVEGRVLSREFTGGSAVLTAQPLSLIDPIMPLGYGFALLDESGLVLFHADKTKNLHENFLRETDWNKQLYAAAFGHSIQRSLTIKYLGNDYQARVIPVTHVSQAPWFLIVYRDVTFVRTLNLQSMTMTSLLLVAILAVPAMVIAIWCLIRQPKFTAEWLWPNRARMSTYVYLTIVYTSLIILLVFLGFTGSSEQNVIACAAIPYTAFLLTLLPLLDRPRRYLDVWWKRSFRRTVEVGQISERADVGPDVWRKCYVLSLVLLLLLVGVLMPMVLFRASLKVERRLGIKQAQLHLASALDRRLMSTIQRCQDAPGVDELGREACAKFEQASIAWSEKECGSTASSENEFNADKSPPWCWIVLDPIFPADGKIPVSRYSLDRQDKEFYSSWFQTLIYLLHLDYNQTAAEMLGVVTDRVPRGAGNVFPDWFWDDNESSIILHWHGVHLPAPKSDPSDSSSGVEKDLILTSTMPGSSWIHALTAVAVAGGVIVAVAFIVWVLARRIFLFHVAPLKMTGALRVAEAVREGRNVLILVPPTLENWRPEAEIIKETVDLMEIATVSKWLESFERGNLKVNTVIEIRNFEHGLNSSELNSQELIQRLLKVQNTQLAAVMKVPPSPEDYSRMFPALEVIDLREEPFLWRKLYEGPAEDLIWKECGQMPALWPIGAQLARDIKTEKIHSEETIASEILERADGYYRLIWKECSDDQKFALAQLAEDGLLNPTNARAIRQLVRRGLITTDPQFRLMNESFRRFARSAGSAGLRAQWLRESRRSGWGKVHGAFITTMILLGAFLLTTQNVLWQSSAAYVTTALGTLGTLFKLFNTYRGGGSTEKAR